MSEKFMQDDDDKKLLGILDALSETMPSLPKDVQSSLRAFLPNVMNIRDAEYLIEWLKDPVKRRYPKVSVDTFLDSPKYLGLGKSVYPKVREICKAVIEGGYREGVEVAGIGAGKSYSSELLACYAAHHLLCLRNPHQNYKLSPDKNIAILNMGINATQAREVVFTGIRNFILMCPFFQQFSPKVLAGTILFENQKILLASGNSKSTTPLGYNVFYAILDEAAFYLDNEEKAVAQEIYESLQRRIVSRFGNEGLLMMISSPRYVEDFIMNKLEESRKLDENGNKISPHIYSIQLPTWKVKYDGNTDRTGFFYFNPRLAEIIKDEDLDEQLSIRKVNYIEDPAFDDTYDVWEIPGEYKASFKQNPEKAKRDFGATPSLTLSGYFPSSAIVREAYNMERENPLVSPGKYEFTERPLRVPYYIHVDIGFNREGTGDHTGFCMGHFGGWVKDEATGETRMKFVIDIIEQIGVTEGQGEIDLSEVRNRIYDLRALGFNIALVTLDGYMSKDFMQILKKKGIKADYLSVDRTIDPYNILKSSIYEKRIDIPFYKPLDEELLKLELVRGVKVDHPIGGSKDVSDAVAGVVMNIAENTHSGDMGVRAVMTNMSEAEKEEQEKQKKIKQYEWQQKMVNRQDAVLNRLQL